MCLFDSSWSTQPQHGWPPGKPSPAPGSPPVTCVFLFITQECVLRTWGHSPTPLLMQEPPHTPTLTGPGLPHGAGPLSPAGHPNTPVYLRASAQDGSAPDFWPPLLTPALTPLLSCPPGTLLLLKFSVPRVPGGGWGVGSNSCPHLSSAGAWPFALGQHGVWDDRKPRESLDPGAGGDLARPWDRMCSGPEAEEGPRGSSSCPLPPSILGWGIHGEGRMGQRWQVRG